MKKTIIYLTLSLVTALIFTACQNDKASTNSAAAPNQPAAPITAPPATTNAAVEHYTCPAGHVGYGSASQGTCSQCGVALVHNQAFHNNTTTTAAPATNPMFQDQSAAPAAAPAIQAPPTAEPAQNAAGVWHYTCNAGCAGGAGAAGTCSNCGGQLAHNQAYHN